MKSFKAIKNVIFFLAFVMTIIPAYSQVTVIKAGKLVDPQTGTFQKNVKILIKGNLIKEVGKFVEIPDGAEIIDLSNKTVLPGLMDCHTHLLQEIPYSENLGNGFKSYYLNNTTPDMALLGVKIAGEVLNSGFTTVRDVGNSGEYADVALKKAINRGYFPGPTMIVTGKIISPFGGQTRVNSEHLDYPLTDYIFADTKDEIKKAIRKNVHLGVDWIKIIVDDQRYCYTAEDIKFIVKEAALAGLKVAAHAVTERGAKNCIDGGLMSIEHGFTMNNDTLKAAKEMGTWLVGTDFSKEVWKVYQAPRAYKMVVDKLKRAYKIGVKMAFGSDVMVKVPDHNRGEASLTLIDTWVDAGIPAEYILKAFTVFAAELLNISKTRGNIKPGMFADIIAVNKNPLKNIKILKKVKFVMKNGVVIKNQK